MRTATYFFRRKNPVFFSIEQVFERITGNLSENYAGEFTVRKVLLPLPSKLLNIIANIRFARKNQTEINHITGDVHYALLGFSSRNVNVLTIHDCVLLHRFSRTDPRFWIIKWVWHDWPARKADCITVISESTKEDLIRFTSCAPHKIRVIPNFIDPAFQPAPLDFDMERPRILFVGTTPNKNLDRLSAALEGIPSELDIIGELTSEQKATLGRHKVSYRQSSKLSREELLQHYRDCDLLAFPSTYEGFGLPVLEAQAMGRPVLTSDLLPMRDVAGAGACLADPHNIASIREGLLRIIHDKEYRDQLIRSGTLNTQKFSLDSVVDQYAALYRELLLNKK